MCIHAWTSQNLHLGNHANSRVEGVHAMLKKYLRDSINDLHFVFEAMERHIVDQHIAASKALSNQRQLISHQLYISFFAGVIKQISSWVLQKMYEKFITLK